jgi:hypothetical protein
MTNEKNYPAWVDVVPVATVALFLGLLIGVNIPRDADRNIEPSGDFVEAAWITTGVAKDGSVVAYCKPKVKAPK